MDAAPSRGRDTVRIEFVTARGDSGETHIDPASLVMLMGDYDFEEEEW